MAFEPGRGQPVFNQQGNPLYSQPNLRHPQTNPGGLIPGPALPRGPEAWSDHQGQRFQSDGANQVWLWESPVFDCRPALSASYGIIGAAVPINNEGALGRSIYLTVIVGEASGTTAPATTPGIICEYFEDGSCVQAENAQLQRLTQDIDITETLLAGGISAVQPFGASPMSFVPVVVGLRFWKLSVRITIPGVAAITLPYFLEASLH